MQYDYLLIIIIIIM